MGVKHMTWAMDHSEARGSQRLVLFVLAERADKETGWCFPSIPCIANDTRLGETAVKSAIKQLERDGRIEIAHSRGRGRSNRYRVNDDTAHEQRLKENGRDAAVLGAEKTVASEDAKTVASIDKTVGSGAENSQTGDREPRENHQEPVESEPAAAIELVDADFKLFWKAYPRSIEKGSALRAWKARLNAGATAEQLIVAAERYADECRRLHRENGYIKYPATFLGPAEHWKEFLDEDALQERAGLADDPLSMLKDLLESGDLA